MFGRPAYAQPRYQRGYSELDALADDLEYRASIARQAARRESRRPASQYWNSMERPHYEPLVYRGEYPRYYHGPELQQPPYTYESDPEYEQRYDYEYPIERPVVRRPTLYTPGDVFTRPTFAPARHIPHTRHASHPHVKHHCVADGLDEYVPEVKPCCEYECDCHLDHHHAVESVRPETTSIRSRQPKVTQSEPQARRPSVPFEDIVSLVANSRQHTARPDHARYTAPASAAPQGSDLQDVLGQVLAQSILGQRVEQSRRVPTLSQSAALGVPDVEALARQSIERRGQAPVQQRAGPLPNEPEVPAHSLGDFIGQVADIVAAQLQQQAQQNGQPAAHSQQHEEGARSGPTVHVRFVPQVQTGSRPGPALEAQGQTQPKLATSESNSTARKASYTYAAPASVQREAIPKLAKASASPALPVPGRTFQHIGSNPRDPGAQARPGAADEVADIKEAIRRSLDRSEDVKPAAATASAPPSAPAAVPAPIASSPASAPLTVPARVSSPVFSANSASAAVTSIDRIEERFVNLTYGFQFPSSPDFPDPSTFPTSSLAAVPELPYTHTNQAIRAYEHALTGLLTELDAVDSAGDEEVRRTRRGLVKRIEHQLEKLETLRKEAWQRVVSSVRAASERSARAVEPEESTTAGADAVPAADANAEREAVSEPVEEPGVAESEGYTIPTADGDELTEPKSDADEEVTKEARAFPDVVPERDTPQGADAEEPNESTDPVPALEDASSATLIDDQVVAAEEPVQTEEHGASHPRRASEPIASLSSSYPPGPTRARRSSPSPSKTRELSAPLQTQEENDSDSLGSSPVEIPSELLSESGDGASVQAQDPQRIRDDVPPSMEESVLLEEKTEFVLL